MSDVTQLLNRLAETEVPASPQNLPEEVHQRVNRMLLIQHLLDFVWRAIPCVTLEFARASFALCWFTFRGSYPPSRQVDRED